VQWNIHNFLTLMSVMSLLLVLAIQFGLVRSLIPNSNLLGRNAFPQPNLQAVSVSAPVTIKNLLRPKVAVVLASEESVSPFRIKPFDSPVTWHEVMVQVAEKMRWEPINNPEYDDNGKNTLENLSLEVFTLQDLVQLHTAQSNKGPSAGADVVLLVGLTDVDSEQLLSSDAIRSFCATSKAVVPLDCTGTLYSSLEKYGAFTPLDPLEPVKQVFDGIIRGQRFKNKALQSIVADLWQRKSSGDILFMALVLADAFGDVSIKSVLSVTNTDSTSLAQLGCMVSNCREEIFDCLGDPECKAALDCLNGCKGNDQVCSYRCITSHETAKFEKFAMCILQKNNCMGNSAIAPIYPDPQPMVDFRGTALSHETAEAIFVGHLKPRAGESNMLLSDQADLPQWSWKVEL
jgi:VDE lipocalin domain